MIFLVVCDLHISVLNASLQLLRSWFPLIILFCNYSTPTFTNPCKFSSPYVLYFSILNHIFHYAVLHIRTNNVIVLQIMIFDNFFCLFSLIYYNKINTLDLIIVYNRYFMKAFYEGFLLLFVSS